VARVRSFLLGGRAKSQWPVPDAFPGARFSFHVAAFPFQVPADLFQRRPVLFHPGVPWNIDPAAATAGHGTAWTAIRA